MTPTEQMHPDYGSCDALAGGDCSECLRLVGAWPPPSAPPSTWDDAAWDDAAVEPERTCANCPHVESDHEHQFHDGSTLIGDCLVHGCLCGGFFFAIPSPAAPTPERCRKCGHQPADHQWIISEAREPIRAWTGACRNREDGQPCACEKFIPIATPPTPERCACCGLTKGVPSAACSAMHEDKACRKLGWEAGALAALDHLGRITSREFDNELGNRIRITVEGPTSTCVSDLTPGEASELRDALNSHAADGTEALCAALYGRRAEPRDYLGGANAKMLYDAASALSNLHGSAWLIEFRDPQPVWWDGVRFTPDSLKAVRFARREDAVRAVFAVDDEHRDGCVVTEHVWTSR